MTDCIFCKIVKGEIPCKKVYEDPDSFAFLDINPRNPGHTLVIPKKHIEDIFSMSGSDAASLMDAVRKVAIGVRKATGTKGISITQSNGQMAGQLVPHAHFHVIPRTEAEKGLGLEGVLPVKKMDEAGMDSMAKKVSGAIPGEEPPTATTEEEPTPEEPEPAKEEAAEEDPPEEGHGKKPDDQVINFDF